MTVNFKARSTIDLIAALAMIATAGVVIWTKVSQPIAPSPQPGAATTMTVGSKPTPSDPVPTASQPLTNATAKGSEAARIGIIEYADLECPACAGFLRKTYAQVMAKFVDTGQVRFFFRHFPLPSHQFARSAAIGAVCAGEQGKFWPLYEHVYRFQPRLDDPGLRAVAKKVGVDLVSWSRCVATDRASEVVDADFEAGRDLGLRGTPTFLIGVIEADGRLRVTGSLYGAQGLEAFEIAIAAAESALSALK